MVKPDPLAKEFCDLLIGWLSGKSPLTKDELIERLQSIVGRSGTSGPARISQELRARGLPDGCHLKCKFSAIGAELEEECILQIIRVMRRELGQSHKPSHGQGKRSEERPCGVT